MQIHNKFDAKQVKSILERENEFITNLLDILPIPVSAIQRDFDEDALVTVSNKKGNKIGTVSNPKTRVKSLEELQNRLLELKKSKTFNYKERLLKKSLKNRIKKREKKVKNKLNRKPGMGNQKLENGGSNVQVKSEDDKDIKMTKPIFNTQGKMVFSKFDFGKAETKNKVKSKLKNDPQKILKDLEAKSAKIKELESSGERDKAEELKQKTFWNSALSKADGQKVKDDPELLKKTIKRREQEVFKSKKKWQARQESVQKAKDERQQKRTENINKRKKDKKMTKLKKAAKKGKIIPGL